MWRWKTTVPTSLIDIFSLSQCPLIKLLGSYIQILQIAHLLAVYEHGIMILVGGFKYFSIFTPTWGNDAIWLIFFNWVETTNQGCCNSLRVPGSSSTGMKLPSGSFFCEAGVTCEILSAWCGNRTWCNSAIRMVFPCKVPVYLTYMNGWF